MNQSGWQDLNLRSQAPRACAIPDFATPWQVGVVGFEPTLSCSRSRRNSRLSYTPSKHPAGVEPAHPPWRGSRQPLHHGCKESDQIVKDRRAPGGTRTHVAALRVRGPRRWTTSAFLSVGSEGLEPSPTWVRTRHAAANTLIPSFVGCSHVRAVGAEGIEPSTWSL